MRAYSIDTEERSVAYIVLFVAALVVTFLAHIILKRLYALVPEPIQTVVEVPSFAFWYSLCFLAFDRWLWKIRIRGIGLSKIPNFGGKYRGTLTGHFGRQDRSIDFDLEIKQRWSKIAIVGSTTQTTARSEMTHISVERKEVRYEFIDEPRPNFISRSHYTYRGVSFYSQVDPWLLSGGYYTYLGSSTHGDIELESIK